MTVNSFGGTIRTLGLVEVVGEARRTAFAARRLGGTSLLEWVVRRISESALLDHVAVLAPDERAAEEAQKLSPANVSVLCPAGDDNLHRFLKAAEAFDATAVVRFRLDHPFVDPSLTDRLVAFAQSRRGLDYAAYTTRDLARRDRSHAGVSGEWCRVSAVAQANSLAVRDADRGDVTRFIWSHPRLFLLGWTQLPLELDRDDVRLVLDGEDDWEHVQQIVDALGHDNLDWRTLAELLKYQPGLRGRMARLNRAEEATTAALAR